MFLDLFDFDGRTPPAPMELGWHPHSGIATVTVMFDGSVRYAESYPVVTTSVATARRRRKML